MKRILEIFSILFIVSGILFISCSKQDTELKTEGTTEKGILSEKAGEAMESAKETVEKAEEAIADSGEKAKEKISQYCFAH